MSVTELVSCYSSLTYTSIHLGSQYPVGEGGLEFLWGGEHGLAQLQLGYGGPVAPLLAPGMPSWTGGLSGGGRELPHITQQDAAGSQSWCHGSLSARGDRLQTPRSWPVWPGLGGPGPGT